MEKKINQGTLGFLISSVVGNFLQSYQRVTYLGR